MQAHRHCHTDVNNLASNGPWSLNYFPHQQYKAKKQQQQQQPPPLTLVKIIPWPSKEKHNRSVADNLMVALGFHKHVTCTIKNIICFYFPSAQKQEKSRFLAVHLHMSQIVIHRI